MRDVVNPGFEVNDSARWMVRLRGADSEWPTFCFFPHAGGSPLSIARLAAALPPRMGVFVANLPRGVAIDGRRPPCRVEQAVDGVMEGFLSLVYGNPPGRLILAGNSYGALLAYEMAWRLGYSEIPVERLIVSGFRSPVLDPNDAPLHRLPSRQLRAELTSRFGLAPEQGDWDGSAAEEALRADLEACDTYHHAHTRPLDIPIDVLHMRYDASVTRDDLLPWGAVTSAKVRVTAHAAGHFPWMTSPDAMAQLMVQLADDGGDDENPLSLHTDISQDQNE